MDLKGILRPVDRMGRIVIPKEIRAALNIEETKDRLEIFLDGDVIVLKKHMPTCVFCDNLDVGVVYNGYNVCKNCIDRLNEIKDTAE
ncbi:MAG: AbrB/MazE/SpoVT family DNA-binding domain-containing protein [Clostridia bacterium]|nr:AbrB/MazE/SpoVT family DNA-binding domain-containing protein [Clostridia bacterium]